MNYSRHLTLRDVEDPEIRVILSGQQFNAKTLAAEEASDKAKKAEESKAHAAKVLAQLVRNQKEIEQLRELHLLQLKHINRVSLLLFCFFLA
jgi:hypothetical protein